EFFSKSLRIVVVVFGGSQIRRVLKYCYFRDQAQRMSLVTAQLPLPCQVQSSGGNSPCVRDTVGGQVGITQPGGIERLTHTISLRSVRDRVFESADRLGGPARERLGPAEHRGIGNLPQRVLRRFTQREATLKSRDCAHPLAS